MSEWEQTTLGSLFAVDNTKLGRHVEEPTVMSLSKYDGFVRADDYFDKRIASSKLDGYKVVQPGEWAFSTIHIDEGSIARNKLGERGVISPMYTTMRFVATGCMPEYAELVVRQPSMLAEYSRRAQGSVNRRRSLSFKEFAQISISRPSLAEQRRIVDVMGAVDAQIEALRDECDRLSRTTSAHSAELLTPALHWESVTVGEVAVTATGRAFPDRFQGQTSGVLPYFKVSDMNLPGNEREMQVAPNWLTEESLSQVKPRVCPAGTVLFPIIGAALRTEKRRILVQPSAFDQNVMGLILSDRITTDFMFAVMSNLRLGELSQAGAVPSVNQKLVSAIQFALPPLDEQIEIGEQLRSLYAQRESLEEEFSRLRVFRSALLNALLNQAIEIPDSYDRILEGVS